MPKRKGEDNDNLDDELLSVFNSVPSDSSSGKKKRKVDDDYESQEEIEESSDEELSEPEPDDDDDDDFDEEEFARLPEGSVQREKMIFARQEKEKRRKEYNDARERLKRNRDIENNKKNLRSSRQKKEQSKDSAIKEISSKRAKKDLEEENKNVNEKSDDISSSHSSLNLSDSQNRNSSANSEDYKFSLDVLKKLQLKRKELEEFYVKPIFEEKVVGFFVRVFFEVREQKPVYRIYQILGVKDGTKFYKIENNVTTDKVLILQYGKFKRDFRMEYVSNQDFDESEYQRWLINVEEAKLPFPDEQIYIDKLYDKQELVNYKLKNEDYDRIVKEKEKRKEKPINASTEMNNLIHKREAAREVGNTQLAEKLNERILELEDIIEQKKMKISNDSKGINSINVRNRQTNLVLNSIYGVTRNFDADDENDPFSRRKTESTLIFQLEDDGKKSSNKQKKKTDLSAYSTFNIWTEFEFELGLQLDNIDKVIPPTVTPVFYVHDSNLSYSTSKLPSKKISFHDYRMRKGR